TFDIFSGIIQDSVLNKEMVKGFNFEVSIDSNGEIGSWTSGHFALRDLAVTAAKTATADDVQQCVELPLLFHETHNLAFLGFAGSTCCELCAEETDCVFAMYEHHSCYHAKIGQTETWSMTLIDTSYRQRWRTSWVLPAHDQLLDLCAVCQCEPLGHGDELKATCRNILSGFAFRKNDDVRRTRCVSPRPLLACSFAFASRRRLAFIDNVGSWT
ncbi:MAG: hypothetical protein AAF658_16725, partial [Myxococcota bacterium]